MNVFFASSSDIALDVFSEILKEHNVVGVLTAPDKPKGRGQKIIPNNIKLAAINSHIKVFDPVKLDTEFINYVKPLNADLMLVFSFGKIFKEEFLNIFPKGSINIHPSLLPKYRGPSPIQTAILNGDSFSGITVQKMTATMDSGNILSQEKFEINSNNTTKDIFDYVRKASPRLTLDAIEKVENGYDGITQVHEDATFCHFLKKEMATIDFSLSAFELKNRINALNPWPLCRVHLENNEIILHRADFTECDEFRDARNGEIVAFDKERGIAVKTERGLLFLQELQKVNKKVVDAKSFYNGNINFFHKIFN